MKQDPVGTVHCLLVDDLDENLLSLEALLRRDGLVCLKAKSGAEALELMLQ
jgi:CheY-like chemotaxis protein